MASKNIKIIIQPENNPKSNYIRYKFTIIAKNGEIIAGARQYNRHQNAHKTIKMLMRDMANAKVTVIPFKRTSVKKSVKKPVKKPVNLKSNQIRSAFSPYLY